MRDQSKNLLAAISIDPQTISTNTTTNGDGVDLRGYDAAMALFESNDTIADGDFALKLQESDDDSTYTDVAAADQIGALSDFSSSNEGVQQVGYIGNKRYIRGVIVSTSVSSGGIMGCTIVRGMPHRMPTS